jgi:hypothetical protein
MFAFPAEDHQQIRLQFILYPLPFSARINQELNQLPVGLSNYSTIPSAGDSHCDGMHDIAKGTHSIHRAYLGRERLYLQNLPTDIK